ncbi:50S ribosomal protein L25/general stress protein Ctc, partial [bacterium]|nr:50S ribosomal protein L25/general stress protein Ctc [bacterium]MCK4325449.1 50S ribosomal protein L25/general stress protein Ctc [bacterium]MCK4437007.1 50S ribosomal protein L25/general stress protein Ctc [bacterium]
MEQISLEAKVRAETGKGVARKLRRQGRIPAILYGSGGEPVPLEVEERKFEALRAAAAGQNIITNLKLNEGSGQAMAIIKDIQYHPVTERMLHIDFCRVSLKKKLTVPIPIAVVGESAGVKEGGILEHLLWEVDVECLPTQIPEKIEVDISLLNIGDTIHVRDLKEEEGIRILTDGEKTILSVVPPRVIEKEEVKEEVAEPGVVGEEKKPEEKKEEKKAGEEKER